MGFVARSEKPVCRVCQRYPRLVDAQSRRLNRDIRGMVDICVGQITKYHGKAIGYEVSPNFASLEVAAAAFTIVRLKHERASSCSAGVAAPGPFEHLSLLYIVLGRRQLPVQG
ncbi:hypothetical protein D3C80_1812510 [compost metagenome]